MNIVALVLLPPLGILFLWSVLMTARTFQPEAPVVFRERRLAYLFIALSAFPSGISLFALTRTPATPFAGMAFAIVFLCTAPLAWVAGLSGIVQTGRLPVDERRNERACMMWFQRIVVFAPFVVTLGIKVGSKFVHGRP